LTTGNATDIIRRVRNTFVFAVMLLSAAGNAAAEEDVVRPVAVLGELSLLTSPQRKWLDRFDAGARVYMAADVAGETSAAWLERSAESARAAGLAVTADYLAAADSGVPDPIHAC
jgi:hypothetical protein